MTRNYYSDIHLHLVWHTKQSLPLLTPEIEKATHRFLRQSLVNTDGVFVHEIGGTETHVHLAVTISPSITISEMIGQLKGSSSHAINHTNAKRDTILQWQAGYGVVSFGTKDLPWVVDYIRNQRQHHAQKTYHARLECVTEIEISA